MSVFKHIVSEEREVTIPYPEPNESLRMVTVSLPENSPHKGMTVIVQGHGYEFSRTLFPGNAATFRAQFDWTSWSGSGDVPLMWEHIGTWMKKE